ncbi:IDEAL domain-containing protein [Radiobacillus kanasensis]|uniref:IDEAL domain-containing protein n=1 Tax=Radiobacillus kanasensis TaxID=2844358 RepID=UPI001E3C2285|nr:IDEAL domain-containing protein [Radiobacillus kanasensis]UFT98577.1 IDEAL domain-containing protein [Radiobacillus kanasensis]
MLSVKMLKPYYIKEEDESLRVVLAYQYFSLLLDDKVYQFVPLESREIRVNRNTQKVENQDDIFVFQRGKEYSRVALADLLKLNDFLTNLNAIIDPYMNNDRTLIQEEDVDQVIAQLEEENIKRLIDDALEKKDRERFMALTDQLNAL